MIEQQGIDIAQEISIMEKRINANSFTKENLEKVEFAVNSWVRKFETQLNVNH